MAVAKIRRARSEVRHNFTMRWGKRDAVIFEIGWNKRKRSGGEKRGTRRGLRRDETRRDETRTEVSRAWDRARPRESRRIAAKYCAGRSAASGAREIRLENGSSKYRLAEQRETNSANLCACVYILASAKEAREAVDESVSGRSAIILSRCCTRATFLHAY